MVIAIIVFIACCGILYLLIDNFSSIFDFLVKLITTVVVFPFSIPSRIKKAVKNKNANAKAEDGESGNYLQPNELELQNYKNALENAQAIIEQKDYEIGLLRNELAAAKSAGQNNNIAFNEDNIVAYLRSLENDSRRIEFCHDTIKFLKHITNDLQSGQF